MITAMSVADTVMIAILTMTESWCAGARNVRITERMRSDAGMEHVELTENEKKKEYLRGYRNHVRRIRRIDSELQELREMRTSISVVNDGMPHGSGQSDMSGYAAELDRLERALLSERHERVQAYKEIVKRINMLRSENEKDVLFYRYIKGLEWYEIGDKMNYSERWIHKLHGKALVHFRLPEEKSS